MEFASLSVIYYYIYDYVDVYELSEWELNYWTDYISSWFRAIVGRYLYLYKMFW